jgi:hypothetical protein
VLALLRTPAAASSGPVTASREGRCAPEEPGSAVDDATAMTGGAGSAPPLAELRGLIQAGAPGARDLLAAAIRARRDARDGHAEWARLCEDAGEVGLALSEYQLALRDVPDDPVVLARLADLYEERGELARAVECAERWVGRDPGSAEATERLVELLVAADQLERARATLAEARALDDERRRALAARITAAAREATDEPDDEAPAGEFTDGDVVRFVHLFAGRENVYARQWVGAGGETGYAPVREPFTVQVARNHLLGGITVGIYPLRLDDTVTLFALDVDITRRALARARGSVAEARRLKDLVGREARRLHAELDTLGVPALLEDSGYKGRHLWVFLERPEAATVVRSFGELFLRACRPTANEIAVEFFPKQGRAEGGVGNLIKLPLGIHRRTGRRSRLLRPDGTPETDPHGLLRRPPRVSRARLHAAIAALKERTVAGEGDAPAPPAVETPDEARPATVDPGAFLPAPPAWTSEDFDTHVEIGVILRGCPVLAELRRKVERHRRLTHEEQVVLQHALGHSSAGVLAVNYLLDACVDVHPSARLQSPLAGNPISCPKIRKRIPHVTAAVPCHCLFDFASGRYPTPRLHLLRPGAAPAVSAAPAVEVSSGWNPTDRARTLRALRVRLRELEGELRRVEGELVAYLERSGATEIALEDGVLRLVQEEGQVPALAWEPRPGGGTPGAAAG